MIDKKQSEFRKAGMKPVMMVGIKDSLHDIFEYKKAYDVHVRKLSDIRNMRKDSSKAYSIRNAQIDHFKVIKSYIFKYKLEHEATKICRDNLRLYGKLAQDRSTSRPHFTISASVKIKKSSQPASSHQQIYDQVVLKQQNRRIKQRIKSSKSSIKISLLQQQEKARQELKNRIRKFTNNSQLKSRRYFSALQQRQRKQTSLSCNLPNPKSPQSEDANHSFHSRGKRISCFYKPQDVIRNRIETFEPLRRREVNSYRKQRASMFETKNKKNSLPQTYQDGILKGFFPTQTY